MRVCGEWRVHKRPPVKAAATRRPPSRHGGGPRCDTRDRRIDSANSSGSLRSHPFHRRSDGIDGPGCRLRPTGCRPKPADLRRCRELAACAGVGARRPTGREQAIRGATYNTVPGRSRRGRPRKCQLTSVRSLSPHPIAAGQVGRVVADPPAPGGQTPPGTAGAGDSPVRETKDGGTPWRFPS